MHHNMRPTTIIQSCRHALAVDEHRSSFSHTPFLAYVRAAAFLKRVRRLGEVRGRPELNRLVCRRTFQRWRRLSRERACAHSTTLVVGGCAESRVGLRTLPARSVAGRAATARFVRRICQAVLDPRSSEANAIIGRSIRSLLDTRRGPKTKRRLRRVIRAGPSTNRLIRPSSIISRTRIAVISRPTSSSSRGASQRGCLQVIRPNCRSMPGSV